MRRTFDLPAAIVPVLLSVLASGNAAAIDLEELEDRGRYDFQVGLGYSEETREQSPSGSIGFQAGVNYDCSRTPFDYGIAAGYYDLGDVEGPDNIRLSVIPIFAQALYRFPTEQPVRFFLAGGAGAYVDRLTGDVDDSHTFFGINGAAGLYSVHGLGQLGYALEARYHGIFEPGEDDARYLSVIASLYID